MKDLKALKAQYEALGKEIEALEKEGAFKPGWYMKWDDNDTAFVIEHFTEPSNVRWDHIEPVTKELLQQFLPPLYDWDKAPEWATIAVMNEDGSVSIGDYEEARCDEDDGSWDGMGASSNGWDDAPEGFVIGKCADWKESLQHRPK